MKAEGRKQKAESRSEQSSRAVLFAHFLLLIALSTTLTFPADAQQNGAAPQKLNPYTGNAEAIVEGQALYKKFNCYACHGMAGGGGMGPNLTDETWQVGDGSDTSLQTQIKEGKGTMPPFKSLLNDEQTWKLIAFVRSIYKGSAEKISW